MQPPRIQLSVRHDQDNNKNSFCRLHPTVARRLRKDALTAYNANGHAGSNTNFCWTVADEKGVTSLVSSGIEFLPLCIRSSEHDVDAIFVSYNGGDVNQGKSNDSCIAICVGPRSMKNQYLYI